MFVTTFILFLIAFIDWVVDLYRTIEAFKHFSASDGSRRNFLRRTTEPTFILHVLTFDLQNMTGEIFMIYRVYTVWGRNRWVILPPILLCGAAFVANIACLRLLASFGLLQLTKREFVEVGFTMALVLSCLTNALCTILITIVIIKAERRARRVGLTFPPICEIARITVDSGAILCCSLAFGAFSYFISPNFQTISAGSTVPIVGITWTLILVRVVRGADAKAANPRFQSQPTSHFSLATLTVPQITATASMVPRQSLSSFI
ncbi:hypothetical protein BD410DRAFT_393085 [Rickenella mellea]|uniref:G protein-coupled receptor n=1 Tax=Rickenella mellea TaxID=50990 RepID=A0A4Y7PXN5_9AGAM|nr:hypothetical protein BD410DRAFT_393085 [Rickenella mellea]